MVRSGGSGVVRPPSELSVLGADRFRRLSQKSPDRVRSGIGSAVNGEGHALVRDPPCTPSPRATATQPEDRTTGVRPSPLSSATAQGTGVAPRGGLLALSLRLRGAQLQQSLRNAADDSAPPKPVGHCGQTPVPPENTGEGSALSLVGRSKAFGQALEKKAKGSHSRLWSAPSDAGAAASAAPQETCFRPGQLAAWMELTVQNAPPTRAGRDARAVPGGKQDAFVRAVRHYLTEASLAAQCSEQASKVDPKETPVRPSSSAVGSLLMAVSETHEGLEGLLFSGVVLEAQVTQAVPIGGVVRLLLHRRHAVFQQCGEAWLPRIGSRLRLHSFSVVAPGVGGRGPLLVPLELSQEDTYW